MSYDAILSQIGEFGTYQQTVFTVLWLSEYLRPIQAMSVIFLNDEPPFRCAVPGLDNDTFHIQSETHRLLVNATIPYDSDTGQFSQCKAYDVFWNGSNTFKSNQAVPCDRWVYDRSAAPNSMVPDFDLVCDRKILKSHMGMAVVAGLLIGSLTAGTLADYFGRKPVLAVTWVVWFFLAVGLSMVQSFIAVIILKCILMSLSMGSFLVLFVIVAEIVGPVKRGATALGLMFPYPLAMAVCSLVFYCSPDWRTANLITSLPTAPFLVIWWFLDESPRWLMTKGKPDQAMNVIRKMAKRNKVTSLQAIEMTTACGGLTLNEQKVRQDKVWKILTNKVMLLRLAILGLNWGILTMCYFGFTLNTGGSIIRGSLHLNVLIQAFMEAFGLAVCTFCSERIGRKPLYCSFILLGGIACLLGAILPCASIDITWVNITLVSIGRFGVGGAFASIYVVTAEMFPTTSRNFGLGLCSVIGRIFGITAPYIGALGRLIPGKFGQLFPLFLFGIGCILCGLCIFLLPETRNKKLPDTIKDAENIQRVKGKRQEMQTTTANDKIV